MKRGPPDPAQNVFRNSSSRSQPLRRRRLRLTFRNEESTLSVPTFPLSVEFRMTLSEAARLLGREPFERGPPIVIREPARWLTAMKKGYRMPTPARKMESSRRSEPLSRSAAPANIPETKTARGVAELAYELWQSRGCPDGSAEEDWFQAERELQCSS